MTNPAPAFTFKPAVRTRVALVIIIAGGTGGGKTRSALSLARGLAGGDDKKIKFIDTEAGRALMYACADGEPQTADRFAFQHGEMRAPFSPERYIDAISAADTPDTEVIVLDSGSHEWDGEGGLQDIHLEVLDEMVEKARGYAEKDRKAFDEAFQRDKLSMGAWKLPKSRHRRMVSRLLQCRSHLILCLRADEKLRVESVQVEGSNYKKTVITQAKDLPIGERWVPVCEKRLPFECSLSILVARDNPGKPIPINIRGPFVPLVPTDRPLTEETGRKLAEWARGGKPAGQAASPAPAPSQPALTKEQLDAQGAAAAAKGLDALKAWFLALSKADQTTVRPMVDSTWKPAAEKAPPPPA